MNTAGISSDEVILWQWGVLVLNATIVYTWLVMAILTLGAWLITRKLSSDEKLSRWQNLLEVIVGGIARQIREITSQDPARFLPFIGSMFLFIAASNLLAFLPGYYPPTGSLSTTAALALCVLVAVPVYGFAAHGFIGYLKRYIQPTPFMLPFHVMGELSRTLALAVRLFGNVMSGVKIVAILLAIMPLVFPVLMQILGLLTGLIHAYIFSVLSMVYIASATRVQENMTANANRQQHKEGNPLHG